MPQRPMLSTALKRLEGTRSGAMKAAFARALLATTITAASQEDSPHAAARASVADPAVAVVAGGESNLVVGLAESLDMERWSMQRTTLEIEKCHSTRIREYAALAMFLAGCLPASTMAQQPGQKTFSSPEEASSGLVAAMQSNDEKALLELLGPSGKRIISSGDEIEDLHTRANFVQRYLEMHRLVNEPDGTTTLYIGAQNWPAPIPLVHKTNAWYFETEAGKKEILYRRIGRNEMSAIQVCRQLATAERDFYEAQHSQYAQTIFSDEGQHNGLYWKAASGEPLSPIGPLVANAAAQGFAPVASGAAPTPYRGYHFHILTMQGKNASGGAKHFIVDGKMTGGFAFVAYPAEYRSSGVMTFIVGGDGVVYQKDLGKGTDVMAKSMKKYDPDSTWERAEEFSDAADPLR
jgi:hypothetical protein